MTLKKFCSNLWLPVIFCLTTAGFAVGQSCIYTDKELLFDDTKDHMELLTAPDGSFHVWRWGPGRVTMDVYDKGLHFVENQVISRHAERLLFARFKSGYYTMLMEPKITRVLFIQNGVVTDRTTEFNRIPTEEMPIAQIRQGADQWFFIQYSPADDEEHSQMHITAVDSGLHYLNSMHITLKYNADRMRRLRLYTLGNDLLLMNSAISDSSLKLTIHKVNVTRGTVKSNSFFFNDELVVPQEVLPYKTGFILQGQAYHPLSPPRRHSAYTYLMQLDSSLQLANSYHTAVADSGVADNMLYWYLPVNTTLLPGDQLLITDYQRNVSWKTKRSETRLRFYHLDSGFSTIHKKEQLTKEYSDYPSLVFSNGPQTIVFYEEMIKGNRAIVHRYRFGEDGDTDRLLTLNPKNRYALKNAIRIGETSFVMPYLRNYKLGLVRVNVPVEE